MRFCALLVFTLTCSLAHAAPVADPVYGPLWLYQGTWHITGKTAGAKPDELKNQCALVGKYFVCQQTVNGQTGALLMFIPKANDAGHYYTQNVNLQGRASGVGDLEITGDRWIYSSRWDQGGGQSTYYRTTNVFSGKNHIHYEQAESSNGRDWNLTNSGDEVRVSTTAR